MTVFSRIGKKLTCLSLKLCSTSVFDSPSFVGHIQRNISSGTRVLAPFAAELRPKAITKDDKREFMAIFPDIVREITITKDFDLHADLTNLIAKIMQYNVSGGKNIRGLTAVYSYKMLAPLDDLTPENIRIAQIIGWCIEMIQGFFIVIDDMVDKSETRRQRPCWYTLPDVGFRAASDAIILQSEAFRLIQRYCRDKPYYIPVVELFLDAHSFLTTRLPLDLSHQSPSALMSMTVRKTTYGQVLDTATSSSNKLLKKWGNYTMDRYNFIVKHKTAYYTFHLPVAVAMYMAGINHSELHRQAKIVLMELGKYFQIQDDYLDVFGEEEITGKRGTDIQEGKFSWLAIVAFQRASPAQRLILEENFGVADEQNVKAVKDVYLELGLPSLYSAYEEETYNLINRQIQQLSAGLPHELFLTLLHKIYGRKQ